MCVAPLPRSSLKLGNNVFNCNHAVLDNHLQGTIGFTCVKTDLDACTCQLPESLIDFLVRQNSDFILIKISLHISINLARINEKSDCSVFDVEQNIREENWVV